MMTETYWSITTVLILMIIVVLVLIALLYALGLVIRGLTFLVSLLHRVLLWRIERRARLRI